MYQLTIRVGNMEFSVFVKDKDDSSKVMNSIEMELVRYNNVLQKHFGDNVSIFYHITDEDYKIVRIVSNINENETIDLNE